MKYLCTIIILIGSITYNTAQSGMSGTVSSQRTNQAIPFTTIYVYETDTYYTADSSGNYAIELPPSIYHLEFTHIGYYPYSEFDVAVKSAGGTELNVELEIKESFLDSVVVQANEFYRSREVPIGVLGIGQRSLLNMPGATMDISKFARTIPGVAPHVAFGYSLSFRGGAPWENSYYIDGIEIPAITHFNVEGASGGPNGTINPMLISNVKFYKGHLPSEYNNSLGGGIALQGKNGTTDKWKYNLTVGATDFGLLAEGPTSPNSSIIVSARESFSQHMLKAIGVPVIPTYYDAQLKWNWKINNSNELSILAMGLYDKYRLNLEADQSDNLLYNIGYIPEGNQQTGLVGLNYKNYGKNSITNVVLSYSESHNEAWKYSQNNTENEQLIDYITKNKKSSFRLKRTDFHGNDKLTYGANINYVNFPFSINRNTYSNVNNQLIKQDYSGLLSYFNYGVFGSFSSWLIDEKMDYNLSLRLAASTFSDASTNPLTQFSPRISTTYYFNDAWRLSGMVGRFSQLPPNVVLSANIDDRESIEFIDNLQSSLGLRYVSDIGYQLSFNLYHKYYWKYPILLLSGISYANATSDYVAVGNQSVSSRGKGRASGFSFQAKKQLTEHFSWQVSYSLSNSQFTNGNDKFSRSVWDNTHAINLISTYSTGNGWQFSGRWFYTTGSPYTPYNRDISADKNNWNQLYRGIYDYSAINEKRLPAFHSLNLRIDKQFNFKTWTLSAYIDVQNVYGADLNSIPYLTAIRTDNGFLENPQNNDKYLMKLLNSDTGRILPTIGLIVDI